MEVRDSSGFDYVGPFLRGYIKHRYDQLMNEEVDDLVFEARQNFSDELVTPDSTKLILTFIDEWVADLLTGRPIGAGEAEEV